MLKAWSGFGMTVLGWVVACATFATAIWWIFARSKAERWLQLASATAAALSLLTLIMEGAFWQNLPWVGLGLLIGAAAAFRRWRPRVFPRFARVLAVVVTVAIILVGSFFTLFIPVPALPAPRGAYAVGSAVFRWDDPTRIEAFTADPSDHREVVVQAWYPAESPSVRRVPYFEAQGRLPGSVLGLPGWYYSQFGKVVVHATDTPEISSAQTTYPVVLFDPGLNNARESYTSLVTDLASQGIVVVTLTHPYESDVALLSDGRVVGQTVGLFDGSATHEQIIGTREADIRFVTDKLERLAADTPSSPLAGHLDMHRLALVGHSLGGATAVQVLVNDSRFLAGVNLDGTLFGGQAALELEQPFMWIQTDGGHQDSYMKAQDRLFSNLQGGGVVVRVAGSAHNDFSDADAYFQPWGRGILSPITTTGELAAANIVAIASDTILSFLAAPLALPQVGTLDQLTVDHPEVAVIRNVAPASG